MDAKSLDDALRPRPAAAWRADDGDVLWWFFPVEEAPYVGTPLDDDWPGHHTHWTPIVVPYAPNASHLARMLHRAAYIDWSRPN